jgi:ribosomal-protein-alanine N-acetyltransferase
MRLECKNITLRKLRLEDTDDMYEYTCMPEISEYLVWHPHNSKIQDKEYIKTAIEKDGNESFYWGIELNHLQKLIGCIHIYNISSKHKRAEISYILNPKFSGKGYATESVWAAINWLFKNGFVRVQALCVEGHMKSEKLMIRCGMSYEGTLRNYAILKDGKCHSMKLYSICREDILN